jgi:hypothetical protein
LLTNDGIALQTAVRSNELKWTTRVLGTNSKHQHFTLKMSATLAKQFEDCAARCFEFARSATTTAGRGRFMQMAREYQSAALLISQGLASDLNGPDLAKRHSTNCWEASAGYETHHSL